LSIGDTLDPSHIRRVLVTKLRHRGDVLLASPVLSALKRHLPEAEIDAPAYHCGRGMRILHTEASCGWGGQEIRILEEARGLIARGHEISLACPPHARIFSEAGRHGVPVIALPIGRKNLRGLFALRRHILRIRPDVINTHSSTDTWLAALARLFLSTPPPLVRTRHISAPIPCNAASRWLYTRATAHIVTTGERLRETLIRENGYPGEMITSIPTGVDPQRFQPGDRLAARQELGLDPDLRYIGIVATLRSWKGHHHLIDACRQIVGHDWRLLIIGDGPRWDYLREMVARLGLDERVRFLGQREDPEHWLPAFDLFCLPSYANEGVPQAILQAMLAGLPIVTTPVGSITEAVEHGKSALIVAPGDITALAQAIQRLLDNPELGRSLGEAARSTALAHHTREAMLDAMQGLFERVTRAH
jgi:glycosyltransferase involved in cell wall biosynthesis